MHNNYYFLKQLSSSLDERLKGYTLISCFSQNKDELIFEFTNSSTSFFIKAHLLSPFSCLTFPPQFNRAKKNSVNLFEEVLLKNFINTTQFENERSFAINFEKGYSLIFKMHSNRSNILLTKEGEVVRIFRNQFKGDQVIAITSLNRTIDWSEDFFTRNIDNLKQAYPTLGKETWRYFDEKKIFEANLKKQWELFTSTISILENPTYFILKNKEEIKFSLLPSENYLTLKEFNDPIEAINEFFILYTTSGALEKEKTIHTKKFLLLAEKYENYIGKTKMKLNEIEHNTHYKEWADVLMANLYQVEKGSKKIVLQDFANNPVTIKLKPELSVQKNAEIFYRKAKNQEIEIKKLSESIELKKGKIEFIRKQLKILHEIGTLADFQLHFKNTDPKVLKKEEPFPFHSVVYLGYQIWIGKNAANNDLLTLKHTHKDDLWLHAKDVSGSHVIIKHQSGKSFPSKVIERAAELAAYNSKRKTESLCPVVYTPKKFVRKRKGATAGTVVVEREKVIMVTPKL